MATRRQTVYIGTSLLEHLARGDANQIKLYAHLFRPVLEWLAKRSKRLQADEDAMGSFREDCQPHLHVRAMKGARIDCDDVRGELEAIVNPDRT